MAKNVIESPISPRYQNRSVQNIIMCYIHCYWSARIDTIWCWVVFFPATAASLSTTMVLVALFGHETCTFWTVSFIIVWKMEQTQNQLCIYDTCNRLYAFVSSVDFHIYRFGGTREPRDTADGGQKTERKRVSERVARYVYQP